MQSLRFSRGSSHVCCMTFDTRTLKYLKVSLEETNISVYSLHNKLDFGERERVLDSFQEHGGVLLAIDNVLPDLALIEADVVVHYDLPMRTGSMQRRRAAVLPRDGDELPAYALRDTAGTINGEDTLLKQYKFI